MAKGIPELSTDTRVIVASLAKREIGEVVTYAEIAALVDRDITGKDRGCLTSARNVLERDHQIHYETVYGEGIKRVTPSDGTRHGTDSDKKRLSKAIRRRSRKLNNAIENADLDEDAKNYAILHASLFGFMDFVMKPKQQKSLEDVGSKGVLLPSKEVLKAFLRKPENGQE
jgi:hypothetical protein